MKKETIFLALIALCIGLLVAGGAFFAYQFMTKPPESKGKIITLDPSPTPVSSNSDELMVHKPNDEETVDSKSVKVSGKTLPGSTVIVSSETDEQVVTPADNGDFSLTTTIGEGVNIIAILSVLPSGEERKVIKTVTYTTESF